VTAAARHNLRRACPALILVAAVGARLAIGATPATAPTTRAAAAAEAKPKSVIYLVDESGSMVSVFGQVKQDLKRSVDEMGVEKKGPTRFNIIFYSDGKPVALFADGMHAATAEAKREAMDFIDGQTSVGGTQPIPAIEMALQEKPQLLYLLTDGFDQIADMNTVVDEFRRGDADGKIRVNCVFIKADEDPKLEAALKQIAKIGHGSFKTILKKDM
jgi:uncharacterized protein with von Willebrand factor type A (vWA) domain